MLNNLSLMTHDARPGLTAVLHESFIPREPCGRRPHARRSIPPSFGGWWSSSQFSEPRLLWSKSGSNPFLLKTYCVVQFFPSWSDWLHGDVRTSCWDQQWTRGWTTRGVIFVLVFLLPDNCRTQILLWWKRPLCSFWGESGSSQTNNTTDDLCHSLDGVVSP